ncbi:MAG: flagellar hook-associated protein FlgL [Rhodocyclaceae bacterium]
MRVSSSQIFDVGTIGVQRNQSALLSTQSHLSTGKRVNTPEDDPVAAAQALVVTQANEVNNRRIENQGAAGDNLKLLDTKLSDVTENMQMILEETVRAGNTGTLSDSDRKAIATDMRQRLAQLLATANSQDGAGQYLFAGFKTNVQPFSSVNDPVDSNAPATLIPPQNFANAYVTYNGDQGQRTLQVDAARIMPTSENGSDVFMRISNKNGALTGGSVFDTIKNMIDTLEKPIGLNATFQADYSTGLADMQAFLDNTLRIQASVGSRLAELDSLSASADGLTAQYQETLSSLQDLDYASAISTLSKQQMQLQAAQQSFVKISSLNLFSYL